MSERAEPARALPPWRPTTLQRLRRDLEELVDERDLAYVVVDDLDAGVAGLVVSAWPSIDERGRLRFDQTRDLRLAVDADRLHAMLREERVPIVEGGASAEAEDELRARELLVGDVFAAHLREHPGSDVETPTDPRRWLAEPIIDITADAREAAKVQYYAAVAGVVTAAELDEIAAEFLEGKGPSGSEPEGGGGGGGPSRPPEPSPTLGGATLVAEPPAERTLELGA